MLSHSLVILVQSKSIEFVMYVSLTDFDNHSRSTSLVFCLDKGFNINVS